MVKRGATGNLPPHVFEAMTMAFATFLKLSQARGENPWTTPELIQRINDCLLQAGLDYGDSKHMLVRLKTATANEFTVEEARRGEYTGRGGEKGGRPPQAFLAVSSAVKPALVKQWEAENQTACDFLSAQGFDGDQLRSTNNNNNNAAALRDSARI